MLQDTLPLAIRFKNRKTSRLTMNYLSREEYAFKYTSGYTECFLNVRCKIDQNHDQGAWYAGYQYWQYPSEVTGPSMFLFPFL
jgi:hypothetical protein